MSIPRAHLPRTLALLALASTAAMGGCEAQGPSYPWASPVPNPAPPAGPATHGLTFGTAPPISGGTLLVLRDGSTAVAADPDRDRVSIVDLVGEQLRFTVHLGKHEEPGRLVEDGAGRVHVALRRSGDVVTIQPATGAVVNRTHVCPAPRGIAYQPEGDLIHVACAGGELVSLPAAGGAPTRLIHLERDLRDVVVVGSNLLVSLFRSAEVLTVDPSGSVASRRKPLPFTAGGPGPSQGTVFEPGVAWRLRPAPGGSAIMVHQRATTATVQIGMDSKDSYNGNDPGNCNGGIVQTAVTLFPSAGDAAPPTGSIPGAALPVDVAVSPDGSSAALVAAGSNLVVVAPFAHLSGAAGTNCLELARGVTSDEPIAVAFDVQARVVVQTRSQGLELFLESGARVATIPLPGADVTATGHALFHHAPSSQGSLACASCHPEGREDGRVWQFAPIGARRTQALLGDITDTAPFHWGGDIADFGSLMQEVFVRRMGGPDTDLANGARGIQQWLSTIPAPRLSPSADSYTVARGKKLFEDPTVGCLGCHSGPKHTNNLTVDVGTGAPLQVPGLVGVAWRAPYLHDGCAATLEDRFGSCGGTNHGNTQNLTPGDVHDLVAYLETL